MKKCSLQVRLTVIVGAILLAACLLLTANSLFAAHTYYGDYAALVESGQAELDPAWQALDETEVMMPDQLYQMASQKFSAQTLAVMYLIVAAALVCTYLAAGQVLRPLKKLTQSVRRMDDRHLDRRVATAGAQGEVLALTQSFNGMLERLEKSFLIQKSFAANAAHELKTPLAVIKSSLQVLEMAPHPQEADYREFMADTGESLKRIIKTVDDLLALANLENVPVDERVALRPLIERVIAELGGRAEAGGVTVSLRGGTPSVKGNSGLLYWAFFNLVENAIKYNRRGGTVTVTLERDGAIVRARCEDTGTGIAAQALPHIFESFYRADPSRSQRIPGSGLGLNVVEMIIKRHGASIGVTSQAGEGSTFTVEFVDGAR